VFLVSCTASYDNDIGYSVVDGELLRNLHHSLMMNDFKNTTSGIMLFRNSGWEQLEVEYFKNVEYVNEYGLKSLLERNEIDPNVVDVVEFYVCNRENKDVYKQISDNFDLSYSDAVFLFKMIEVFEHIEGQINISLPCEADSDYLIDGISWGCAVAIAGTLGLTISAIWITGGAALVMFIISKGLATSSFIDACS